MSDTRVVYVYGTGRNGSTVLGQALALQPGWAHLGELHLIWQQGVVDDRLCECGQRFSRCTFWQSVLEEMGITRPGALQAADDYLSTCRIRHSSHALGRRSWPSTAQEYRFQETITRLYRAIWRVSGASVIVDTSKAPTYGALAATAVDEVAVHLVRDPRAVAYSWEHQKPDPSLGEGGLMPRVGFVRTAIDWNARARLVPALTQKYALQALTVTYEEFVTHPYETVMGIINATTGERPSDEISVLRGGRITRAPGHSIAGNPIRFERAEARIHADERWKTAMPTWKRLAVSSMCWPDMRRYGLLQPR